MGRPAKRIEAFGETKTIAAWSDDLGISAACLYYRLNSGASNEEALTAVSNRVIDQKSTIKRRHSLPLGFRWCGIYDVSCPDGSVLSGVSKNKNHFPKPISGECLECGSVLYWDLVRRGKNNPKQFCNRSCACIYRNKKMKGVTREKLYDDIQAKCKGCGISFTSDWLGSCGYRQYCNNDCLTKNHKPTKQLGDRPLSDFGLYVGAVKTSWSEFTQRECIVCGSLTTKQRYSIGGYRHCSIECQEHSTAESKRKARRNQGKYNHVKRAKAVGSDWEYGITLKAVAKRDGMKCQICGCTVHKHKGPYYGYQPKAWSIDHIVAINGPGRGSHTWDNVQLACIECNTMKGIKGMDEVAA